MSPNRYRLLNRYSNSARYLRYVLEAHGVKRTGDGVLYVAKHRVDPFECRLFDAFSAACRDNANFVNGSFVDAKRVPLVSVVRWWQRLH